MWWNLGINRQSLEILFALAQISDMIREWVRCHPYCFWDWQIIWFDFVFSPDKFACNSVTTTSDSVQRGLHQHVAFLSCQKVVSKLKIENLQHTTSFPLIMSHTWLIGQMHNWKSHHFCRIMIHYCHQKYTYVHSFFVCFMFYTEIITSNDQITPRDHDGCSTHQHELKQTQPWQDRDGSDVTRAPAPAIYNSLLYNSAFRLSGTRGPHSNHQVTSWDSKWFSSVYWRYFTRRFSSSYQS